MIDREKVQDTLQASLESSRHEKIKDVECPSNQPVDPGTTFTCTVISSAHRREEAILKIRDKEADLTVVGVKPISRERRAKGE